MADSVLSRFRQGAFPRLERIDAGWAALLRGAGSPEVEEGMFRDLHTLRGEAGVLGAKDVVRLARRLEDLFFAARERGYRVHDDVDIVATMAIQFVGILLRKRGDAEQPGIDLEGFLKQIEDVLSLQLRRSSLPPAHHATDAPRLSPRGAAAHLPRAARERFASAATTVYLEHLRATGPSAARLRGAWEVLSRAIMESEAVPLGPTLHQHGAAVAALAPELGKTVRVLCDAAGLHANAEVVEALSTAVLHAARNAVDHGIETPAERACAGKSPEGTIRVTARGDADQIEVTVEDDGAGVDVDRVRDRGVRLGLLTTTNAASASREDLLELIFAPHVSTREEAGDVSGRGIGLDAVRAAIRSLGGSVTLETTRGAGTKLSMRVPQAEVRTDVLRFYACGTDSPFAVSASWSVEDGTDAEALDPFALVSLPVPDRPGDPRHAVRFRRGRESLTLWVSGAPTAAVAARVCPTAPGEPVEIVGVEGIETLLLRPDVLLTAIQRGQT